MQKTAYGLRISDWSSDVCSSDLRQYEPVGIEAVAREELRSLAHDARHEGQEEFRCSHACCAAAHHPRQPPTISAIRDFGGPSAGCKRYRRYAETGRASSRERVVKDV